MRKGLFTILMALCTVLGCRAQVQGPTVEPVRFKDGTVADPGEAGRLAEAWDAHLRLAGEAKGQSGEAQDGEGADTDRFRPGHTQEAGGRILAELDYKVREIVGEDGLAGLLDKDPLRVETVIEETDTLLIIKHISAFVRLALSDLPAGGHIDRIDLVPMYGGITETALIDLESGAVEPVTGAEVLTFTVDRDIPDSGELVLWTTFAPQNPGAIALIVHETAGILTARIAEAELQGGMASRWDARCLLPMETETGITARPLMQKALTGIGAGGYSGIAYIGGDNYAVVDDNLPGSGILQFRIPIAENGNVGVASMLVTEGAASGSKRDGEGIAFVPSSASYYVSSETHQEIREYNLLGQETGNALRVPEDLSAAKVDANRGFEALTYNENTGLYWTTTESPLNRDTFLPRILRLQAFDADGNPAGRYLYQTESPSVPDASKAQAYVFGVPAMAALDDGRLVILEREVYVPGGGFLEKLRDSFTRMNLYVVDPAADGAGILRKGLLCTFTTGALDLANYEGMCLGPTLGDGRRCLVLIADSQQGSGGLVQEYVKVILLR